MLKINLQTFGGRGASGLGGGGGAGGGFETPNDKALAKVSHPEARLEGIRTEDIKPGYTISDSVFNSSGEGRKREEWTFHPKGYDTFKSQPHSDIKVTDVKVTNKTVKVKGLFDRAITKRDPKPSDFGKDFIEVTKTFKKGDITQRRHPK